MGQINYVFAPVRLASETVTFEKNSVKTNKDRPIQSATIMFSRKSSFWQYKAGADIVAPCLTFQHFRLGIFGISTVVTIISRHHDRNSAYCNSCYRSVVCLSICPSVTLVPTGKGDLWDPFGIGILSQNLH